LNHLVDRAKHTAPTMPARKSLTAVALTALLVGCASANPGPRQVIDAYVEALREQRYTDAYRMLSADTRQTIGYEEFERLARSNPEEVSDTIHWLERIDPTATLTARLELPAGDSLLLIEENGQWRLDPTALDFYGQRTPRQALRSFVRALRRRRYDVVLRFVPRRLAEGLTAETLQQAWENGEEVDNVQRMLDALEQSLNNPIEVIGDRATLQYGVGLRFVAQLVREDGIWKIEDPQ
jgi:hypothetical protein